MFGALISSMLTVTVVDHADSIVGSREHLALALALYVPPTAQDFWA